MNRIMITGGAGSLGRELVDYIHETNKDDLVIVYSRDETKHAKYYRNRNNVKCVIGDIRDKNKLKQVLVENSVNDYSCRDIKANRRYGVISRRVY